ncbi:hypothetical protein EJ05DRAFT_486765 [Pseudovirgaria hyperparasitica]|uniref:Uncharacterized protein n=1 Tax=Pseudovirgaria hyperparasitica TaxID=470096 RepID=A0A6A6W6T7_9PEZI|nr:uncharacterized protein EJ05DRAFT_486765 [Pseudovirgaria hyperparasitica]KAF2757744.1 hypothetical protein EJ05DRAFT_486765 [Pseudovirgaria hyperparasitica]
MTTLYQQHHAHPPLSHQHYSPTPPQSQQDSPILAGSKRAVSHPPPPFPDDQLRSNPNLVGPNPYDTHTVHFDPSLATIPSGQPLPVQNPNLIPVYPSSNANSTPVNMSRRPSQDPSAYPYYEDPAWYGQRQSGHHRSHSEGHLPPRSQAAQPYYDPSYYQSVGHVRRGSEGGHNQHSHSHEHRRHHNSHHDEPLDRPSLGDSMFMAWGMVKRVLGGKKEH